VQQVKNAQAATDARVDMVTKMRQDIERLRQVEQGLRDDVDKVADQSEETTATVYDIETKELPWAINNINQLKTKVSMDDIPPYAPTGQQVPTPPPPQQAPAEPAAADTTQEPANQPVYTPFQIATAKKLGLSGDLQNPNLKFAESAFARSIAWATGKIK
jgi:hypothetical protein